MLKTLKISGNRLLSFSIFLIIKKILAFSCRGGTSCLLMAFFSNPVLSVGCMILLRVSSALFVPVQMNVENRGISTSNRAAILSAYSIVTDLVAAGTNLTFGKAADFGVPSAMLLGAGFCFSAFLLYCIWQRTGSR